MQIDVLAFLPAGAGIPKTRYKCSHNLHFYFFSYRSHNFPTCAFVFFDGRLKTIFFLCAHNCWYTRYTLYTR